MESNTPAARVGLRHGELAPSLATLVPKYHEKSSSPALSKSPWVQEAEQLMMTWKKVAPCMEKYQAFLKTHEGKVTSGGGFKHDLVKARFSMQGKSMQESSIVAIGEFYLCVALQTRPEAVSAAGDDSAALMQVARMCAEEDFEPFLVRAREFVSDYDADLHKKLEETTPLFEVSEGLFWHENLNVAAPAEFQHFLSALGYGSGQGFMPQKSWCVAPGAEVDAVVAQVWNGLLDESNSSLGPARRAAELAYRRWFQASSMPVKASIMTILTDNGLLIAPGVNQEIPATLLPQATPASTPAATV